MTDSARRLVPARIPRGRCSASRSASPGCCWQPGRPTGRSGCSAGALGAVLLAALVWPLRNALDRHLPKLLATILSILMLIVAPGRVPPGGVPATSTTSSTTCGDAGQGRARTSKRRAGSPMPPSASTSPIRSSASSTRRIPPAAASARPRRSPHARRRHRADDLPRRRQWPHPSQLPPADPRCRQAAPGVGGLALAYRRCMSVASTAGWRNFPSGWPRSSATGW